MLIDTGELLNHARQNKYAVGGFNIYNLEGGLAVISAAEELDSPVILQILPSALDIGGTGLIAMCLEIAEKSLAPVAVHLDHCSSAERIDMAITAGLTSVMADGSALDYQENIQFTRAVVSKSVLVDGTVEAELGRLSGEEDGLSIADREAQLTDPDQAADFVDKTGISALAVCIGNIHGKYHRPPKLDFSLLAAIAKQVSIPLVLHGTSGLPDAMIEKAIRHGVCKFNVNTEIRSAYLNALAKSFAADAQVELVSLMQESIQAMKEPVQSKLKLFCSVNKAKTFTNI
jgi:tagatose 1,6-diphosphate aldolase GatY/KbaY